MKTIVQQTCTPAGLATLLERPLGRDDDALAKAAEIVADVARDGDAAVRHWTSVIDRVERNSPRVPAKEIEAAGRGLTTELRQSLAAAGRAIEEFHRAQLPANVARETYPGVTCRREWRPLERVGLYVPGGTAPLLSTVLMLGIPAKIAGCKTIILCTPPQRNGSASPQILAVAAMLGIVDVFAIGGAQAIAAMAVGTESVPRIDKLFGPGNRYVAAAKTIVSNPPYNTGIDLPAGPTELLVVADASATPSWIAADLLSQAEHGEGSQVVLVSPSPALVAAVQEECRNQLALLPRKEQVLKMWERSFALVTASVDDAIAFANDYAPEHLQLAMADAAKFAPRIQHAGSVFVGEGTSVVYGDYASGTNHTLPTGGSARWTGGVTVESFMKSISFQEVSPEGRALLAPVVTTLARAEELEAHARAAEARLR